MNAFTKISRWGGCTGTVRETVEYLESQKSKGWPGSVSIKGKPLGNKKSTND